MNVEKILTEELGALAGTVATPPPPSVADLVAASGRRTARTRRTVVVVSGLVAAAVVGAVLLGTSLGTPKAGPSPSHHPTGTPKSYYAAGTPYVVGTRLYIAHQPQPGAFIKVITAGRYAMAWRADPARGFLVLHDGKPLAAGADIVTQIAPVLSSTGITAWLQDDHGTGVVVAEDLRTGKVLGRLSTGQPSRQDGGVPFQMDAVRDDGTVYFTVLVAGRSRNAWTWSPGSAPRRGEPIENGSPTPKGFPADANVATSPDGLWDAGLIGTQPYTALVVQKSGDPSSRFTVPLRNPESSGLVFLDWRSPTVLAVQDGGDTAVQVCDIVQRSCAVEQQRASARPSPG